MVRHYHEDEIPTVYNIEDIPGFDIRQGVEQKIFRGIDLMLGFTTLEPGMQAKPHSHPWEQITIIFEGQCDFTVGNETIAVEEKDVFFIPPGVDHYAEPNSDEPCVNLDLWALREDYVHRAKYQSEFVTYDDE